MRLKATIPKKSASLLLLRPAPPHKISFFDYDILVLRRSEKMTFGAALVFPGGKIQHDIDQSYSQKFGMHSRVESAALRESFEETGLFFSSKPIVQSEKLARLNKIRLNYIANVLNGVQGAKQKSYAELSELLEPTPFMVPFIRLITIPLIKRRYDTTFFVLPLKEYKYINFFKYAEHEKYLHKIDQIQHCTHEYTDFRWMSPAQILSEHFSKKSIIAPPQFIMLNIMLRFRKHRQFVNYLKSLNGCASRGPSNYNMAPNIISLIENRGSSALDYPFAATLIGDKEFPYQKILENQSCEQLRRELHEWKTRAEQEGHESMNRFLFKQGKKFFESEFEVLCNATESVIGEMRNWKETRQTVENLIV